MARETRFLRMICRALQEYGMIVADGTGDRGLILMMEHSRTSTARESPTRVCARCSCAARLLCIRDAYRLGVPESFTETFAAGLASYGDQPCIEFKDRWYTGDDITEYADAIAAVLRDGT